MSALSQIERRLSIWDRQIGDKAASTCVTVIAELKK